MIQRKNKLIIFILFLLQNSLQQNQSVAETQTETDDQTCIQGCSMCSNQNKCLLCDIRNNYFLNSKGKCEQVVLENCEFNSIDACLQCQAGYVYFQSACVLVADSIKIDNCLNYNLNNNSITCVKCNKDYYISAGKCIAVTNPIENCIEYSLKGDKCVNCSEGIPDLSFKKCTTIPENIKNCKKFSFFNCQKCNTNYLQDKNFLFMLIKNQGYLTKTQYDSIINILLNIRSPGLIMNTFFCNPIQDENCEVPIDNFTCQKCKEGFFVDELLKCKLYPEERIENCELYQTKTICKQCIEGYWRKTYSECVPVIEISQCQNYSRVEESKCLRCQDAFYISNNNCVEREISLNIQFCENTFAYLDQCEKCSTGYQTNQDMSKCLPVVSNCGNHQKLMDSLECIDCINNFYLKNQECFLGDIEGCKKYSSETSCQDCQNGYYKEQTGDCKSHELLSQIQCFQFSITSQNYCEQCHKSRVKYQAKNLCLEVETKMENCVEYLNAETCNICDSSISYLKDGKCEKGNIANCLEYDLNKNKCLNCTLDPVTGFGTKPNSDSENNSCVLLNPNVYQNCQKIEQIVDKKCSYCKEGYYQQVFNDLKLQWCVPRSFYLLSGKTNTDNCNLYDYIEGKCLRCLKKSDGKFYVIHNGTCLDSCPENFSILTQEFKNNIIQTQFVCKPLSYFQNQEVFEEHFVSKFGISCERFEIDVYDNGKIYCAACSDDHIALFETNTNIFGLKYQYLMTTSVNSTFSIYNLISPVKSCLSREVGLITNQQATFPVDVLNKPQLVHNFDNCRFLRKYGENEQYYCSSCKHGYTGKVVKSVGGAFVYMIEVCEIMTQCKSDVWIDGLGSKYHPSNQLTQINESVPINFDYFLSCHQCNQETGKELIPTFTITINYNSSSIFVGKRYQEQGIGMYGIGTSITLNDEPYKFESQQMKQTTCQERGLSQKEKFPTNCAVQMLNIFYKLHPYNTNQNQNPQVKLIYDENLQFQQYSNPLCVACAPGYRPSFNTSITSAIDYCEKISNCLSSNIFNQCEVCQPGYTLKENASVQTCDIDKTIPLLDNCLISSSTTNCFLCKKGYYLNSDKKCDSVSTYKCKQQGFYQSYKQDLKSNVKYYQNGIGCEQCTDDSILIFFPEKQTNCIKNELLLINSALNTMTAEQIQDAKITNVSFFIKNCQYYKLVQDTIKCQQCKDKYILQIDFTRCWAQESFPNCQMTEIGGIICKQCNEGYYFENSTFQCLEGSIQNCLVYLNKNNCYQCDENFISTSIKGNKTVCVDVSELNCDKLDEVQSIQGILECKQCKKGFQQINTGKFGVFPLIQCLQIPTIDDCLDYNKSSLSVIKSSLECTQCNESTYLVNNICKQRQRKQEELNCSEFEGTLDQCKTCKLGYYFNSDMLLCKQNPSSTQGCIEFKSEKECLKCKKNMYLKNNKCFEVEETIDKCEFYLNSFECLQCEKNYFLVKQRCEQSYASNCLTQIDLKECKDCENGWGLSLSGNVTSCQEIFVHSCDLPDQNSIGPNFECLNCSKNHYLETITKQCIEQLSEINQCMYYYGVKQCRECDGNYILSQDNSSCLNLDFASSFKDANCKVTQQKYQCALCESGYIFDEIGDCIQCQAGKGCYICDSSNINVCLICQSGFYQSASGECQSYINQDATPDVVIVAKHQKKLLASIYAFVMLF